MRRMGLAGVGLVATLLLGGTARSAAAEPELRARVDGLLGAYRTVTVAEWRALGPDAAPVLEAVAADLRAVPTRRARALAALGVVRPTAAAPLATRLASDVTAPPVLRSAAVEAAASVLGVEARGILVPLLRDRQPLVRLRSAQTLAASGEAGCRAVIAEAARRPASDPVARTAASCEARLRSAPAPTPGPAR